MATFAQMIFSNGYSWIKMYKFGLKFHCTSFQMVQLTVFHNLFGKWLGAGEGISLTAVFVIRILDIERLPKRLCTGYGISLIMCCMWWQFICIHFLLFTKLPNLRQLRIICPLCHELNMTHTITLLLNSQDSAAESNLYWETGWKNNFRIVWHTLSKSNIIQTE